MADGIRVTVEDLKTGDTETVVVPMHEYYILYTGDVTCDTMTYKNGTHVLTIRGRRPRARVLEGGEGG